MCAERIKNAFFFLGKYKVKKSGPNQLNYPDNSIPAHGYLTVEVVNILYVL